MAEMASLPVGNVDQVLDGWINGSATEVPLVTFTDGLWSLAEGHALEREFIRRFGKSVLRNRELGRKRARKK